MKSKAGRLLNRSWGNCSFEASLAMLAMRLFQLQAHYKMTYCMSKQ